MKLIRIDRTTIRKNLNEGSQTTTVSGIRKGRFTLKIKPAFFNALDWLTEFMPGVFGQTCNGPGENDFLVVEGVISYPEAAEKLKQEFGESATVMFAPEIIEVSHAPEPAYFYKYENTPIQCLNCNALTGIDDIELIEADLEYPPLMKCPVCGEIDDFETFTYEKIENILKQPS